MEGNVGLENGTPKRQEGCQRYTRRSMELKPESVLNETDYLTLTFTLTQSKIKSGIFRNVKTDGRVRKRQWRNYGRQGNRTWDLTYG